jgi:hypothetical protein
MYALISKLTKINIIMLIQGEKFYEFLNDIEDDLIEKMIFDIDCTSMASHLCAFFYVLLKHLKGRISCDRRHTNMASLQCAIVYDKLNVVIGKISVDIVHT